MLLFVYEEIPKPFSNEFVKAERVVSQFSESSLIFRKPTFLVFLGILRKTTERFAKLFWKEKICKVF